MPHSLREWARGKGPGLAASLGGQQGQKQGLIGGAQKE